MSRKDKSGKKGGMNDLIAAVRKLERVKQQARALGIFTNDRELLECPKCGLLEDVMAGGAAGDLSENQRRDQGLWSALQTGG